MARLAVYRDGLAATIGEGVLEGPEAIELFALLIEADHGEIVAEAECAAIRRQGAGEKVQKGRLAGAVRPDNADPRWQSRLLLNSVTPRRA